MALDLSSNRVIALIKTYMAKPREFYVSETRFANPHDLAAVIKWALARLSRVFPVPIPTMKGRKNSDQQEETILIHRRGFIELDSYATWSAYEKRADYPLAAFSTFLEGLASSSAALLVALLSLLSSTTAYSLQNGMTASRLSRLFGVLIFGAPEDETFDKTYDAYLKASNATEHLLLAYIRDMGTMEPLPTRLADVVKGYPSVLATELWRPGKGVRGIPCTTISRQVRLYSSDLLQQAASLPMERSQCSEWDICTGPVGSSDASPQLADRYRKLINLRSTRSNIQETYSHRSVRLTGPHLREIDGNVVDSFASLADEAWDNFTNKGFAMPPSDKFSFDLRESERKARAEGPKNVQWSQFEQSGFELSDEGLKTVLAFDETIQEEIKRLPEEKAEILTKIRKTNKTVPPFAYDTRPAVKNSPSLEGRSDGQMHSKPYTRLDEVFVEVFADVLLGNGWSNRDELTHREANFTVVLYKAKKDDPAVSREGDLLTAGASETHCFVIEEVVPAQYRSELEAFGRKKTRSRASIRNVTRMIRRKENQTTTTADAFLDDVLRRSANGLSKPDSRQQSTTSTNSIEKLNTDGQSTSGKLLTLLKNRASKRLRKKTGKHDEIVVSNDVPPPPPPKGRDRSATRSSWDSIDFEARSLHDSEGDAVALCAGDDIAAQVLRSTSKNAGGDSNAWLDITVRSTGEAQRGGSTLDVGIDNSRGGGDGEMVQQDLASVTSGERPESAKISDIAEQSRRRREERGSDSAIDAIGWSREDVVSPRIRYNGGVTDTDDRKSVAHTQEKDSDDRKKSAIGPHTGTKIKASGGSTRTSDENYADGNGAGTTSTAEHLRNLPDRSTSTLEEREMAREARIEAAKERARQIRAKLDADGLEELKSKQARRTKASSEGDSSSSSHNAESVLLTPVKRNKLSTSPSPDATSMRSDVETAKDNPFAKDRFSGRVANLTSKFGGVVPKSSPPNLPEAVDRTKKSTLSSRPSIPMTSLKSDTIYPKETASSISRDTKVDTISSKEMVHKTDAATDRGLDPIRPLKITDLEAMPSKASDDTNPPRSSSGQSAPAVRLETIPHELRQRYQPGMPLSNVEEERESVLSGSNM
jgi:hypothetical protein